MSLMTVPHDSIRTVRPTRGLVSSSGLVRVTYIGVLSIWKMFPLDCSSVPNHARISGLSDSALFTNSQMPDWIRSAHSATMFSSTVHRAHMNTAWENGWAWMGRNHDGQIV